MTKPDKIPTFKTSWNIEDYEYEHSFSVEKNEQYIPKIIRNGKELKKPKNIFKFYSNSEYNLDSILKGYFYFSKPENFNDPFDCIQNRLPQIIKTAKKIDPILEHRKKIGVCCFSEINDNPLMWGHYTNNYNGFCLKIKTEALNDRDFVSIKLHTSYLKNYQPCFFNDSFNKLTKELKSYGIDDSIHNSLQFLYEYSAKFYDWNYEREYRAISFNSEISERKHYFDKQNIQEIYIGYRMKKENNHYYNLLMHILKTEYPDIKIYEVKINSHKIKIEFESIE